MTWTILQKRILPAGVLLVAVLVGCPSAQTLPGPAPSSTNDFQGEAPAMYARLRAKARQTIPNLPDDTLIIGVLQDPRGRNGFMYVPSELHFPQRSSLSVAWVSWDGSFTLTLRPGSQWPFKGPQAAIVSTPGNPHSAIRTLDPQVIIAPARYHFTVELTVPSSTTPLSDPDCPPIIID
jgi:hypothetical protein